MTDHEVVSRQEWAAGREELLAREKEHTRLGDELARRSIADAVNDVVPHLNAARRDHALRVAAGSSC